MYNVLLIQYAVRVLNCLPLYPIQNWSNYAYRKVRFCTDNSVPLTEAVQPHRSQI